jgi:hypothetical protein
MLAALLGVAMPYFCVRKYFQNKILEIFLSPIEIYTCGQNPLAYWYRCINEFCKTTYIVYGEARGKVRASDWSTIFPPFLVSTRVGYRYRLRCKLAIPGFRYTGRRHLIECLVPGSARSLAFYATLEEPM